MLSIKEIFIQKYLYAYSLVLRYSVKKLYHWWIARTFNIAWAEIRLQTQTINTTFTYYTNAKLQLMSVKYAT